MCSIVVCIVNLKSAEYRYKEQALYNVSVKINLILLFMEKEIRKHGLWNMWEYIISSVKCHSQL